MAKKVEKKFRESEADFRGWVLHLAALYGWTVYYVPDSRWCSCPGFPDLTLRRSGKVLFRELKTETGRLSREQEMWLGDLRACGCDVGVWRPAMRAEITDALKKSRLTP